MNNIIYFFVMNLMFLLVMFFSLILYYLNLSMILEWLMYSINTMNVEMYLLIDWISCLFISVVLLISSMIILYSSIYMNNEKFIDRFMKLVILFILSMILMILSPNLISILFGWDGLGLISYCLVIFYQNFSSYNSGMVTVLCNRIGDVGLLMSIGILISNGSWSLFSINLMNNLKIIMIMIFIAGITKSAQIPFSVWLPMAMAAPTPVSALVHSSTLVTAGVYLLIRFNKYMINLPISEFLFFISIFTMFMSGLMANLENDLKKIIALSTLSQLGLMMMILSLGQSMLAYYHLLVHAIFKSLLFMCAGVMIHMMNNNQDIRLCGNLNEFIPFIMMSFYISSLSLSGFPFMAGFYSKDLIMEMIYMMKINMFMMMLMLMSLMFTVSYSVRLFYYLYFGENKVYSFYFYKEEGLMNSSMMILLMMSLFSGSMLSWSFFMDEGLIYLTLNMKMITNVMMILGLSLSMILFFKKLINLYMFTFFVSSMWFMNYMFMYLYKPYLNLSEKIYLVDKSWIEFSSKFMILNFLKMKFFKGNFKMFMFSMVVLFHLIMIFMFM